VWSKSNASKKTWQAHYDFVADFLWQSEFHVGTIVRIGLIKLYTGKWIELNSDHINLNKLIYDYVCPIINQLFFNGLNLYLGLRIINVMPYIPGGWMQVIIGSHFVPLEGKFLLIALVIGRITLNVIVRQMPINVR
jgi:hypothetical protein